jgi:hypothetical protein
MRNRRLLGAIFTLGGLVAAFFLMTASSNPEKMAFTVAILISAVAAFLGLLQNAQKSHFEKYLLYTPAAAFNGGLSVMLILERIDGRLSNSSDQLGLAAGTAIFMFCVLFNKRK